MIRIAICDDDNLVIRTTDNFLKRFIAMHSELEFETRMFHSANKLLEAIEAEESFQIYLLDIIMPDQDGIEVGRKIREKDSEAILIYLSASPDYALKAFHVYAFQYLLKPLTIEKFFPTLEKALMNLKQAFTKYFVIKTKEGILSLSCLQIQYIEYFNHNIYIYMNDGTVYESMTLRKSFDDTIKDLLQENFFVKPHKSFLVNLNHVKALQEKDFIMNNNSAVPISRSNYTIIKKQFFDFLQKQNGESGYEG